jgi:CHAT domain-containing protein
LKLNADLVVLSACKTGLGKRIRGEGVSGLFPSIFMRRNAERACEPWNVYDRSTAEFMKMFYQNMEREKLNKAEALKEARLHMIQRPEYSHSLLLGFLRVN